MDKNDETGIATLLINNPKKKNALSGKQLTAHNTQNVRVTSERQIGVVGFDVVLRDGMFHEKRHLTVFANGLYLLQ